MTGIVSTAAAWTRLAGLFFRELALSVKEVTLTVWNPKRASRSAIALLRA